MGPNFTKLRNAPESKVMTNLASLNNAYLYLGYPNVRFGIMYVKSYEYWYIHERTSVLSHANLLYENGGAKIFYQ